MFKILGEKVQFCAKIYAIGYSLCFTYTYCTLIGLNGGTSKRENVQVFSKILNFSYVLRIIF